MSDITSDELAFMEEEDEDDTCIYGHDGGEEMVDEDDDDFEYWYCHDCGAEWEKAK